MTDRQLYILVGFPLVGILANTALYVHLSGHVDALSTRIDTRLDLILGKLADIDTRVSVLEDRAQR